ncbi:magnesium/cobalt transporter CorA [Desulfatiglans anilini]|uniref:magnesium/cobalt transporter CorA n=1 Tax=Desulfatiglans anilini TaxID=90728 RepID=UPI00041D940D|nr:magnesium/cobalt transporter CorA [Desulfatiglans anilini]
MGTYHRKVSSKAGLPPGTLVHVGERKAEEVQIALMQYNASDLVEREVSSVEECEAALSDDKVSWINVSGVHEAGVVGAFGRLFGLHPLLLEDVLHTGQRPKQEDYEGCLFVVLRMLTFDEESGEVLSEQISLVVGPRYVLSFQEREGDVFGMLRDRIRSGKGRIRKMGADYLAYALMDAVVDQYFVILENFGEQLEELQDLVLSGPMSDTLESIQTIKREMLWMRKSVWPLREVLGGLQRGESPLMGPEVQHFLRDVYDHTIQVVDTLETFRDMAAATLDVYLSSLSNRMNEVMKVLTIIATIFIPLTFIAGVYGMNFRYMPELEWRWGYAAVWLVMIVAGGLMVLAFRRKKWL